MDDKNVIFALMLEEESFMADFSLTHVYKDRINNNVEHFFATRVADELVSLGAFVSLSSEYDVIDYIDIEHEEHGFLDKKDLTYSTDNQYYALGPQAPLYIDENYADLLSTVETYRLDTANKNIQKFGLASAKWTGLPEGIRSSAATKKHLQAIIRLTRDQVESLSLSNVEAFQMIGLIEAAEKLLELEEPPKDIVWLIIGRLGAIASLAPFVKSIILKIMGN